MMKTKFSKQDLQKVRALLIEGLHNKPQTRNFANAVEDTRKGDFGTEYGFTMAYENPVVAIDRIAVWVKCEDVEGDDYITATIDFHDTTGDPEGVSEIYNQGFLEKNGWHDNPREISDLLGAIDDAVHKQLQQVHENITLDRLQRGEIETRDLPAEIIMGRVDKWEWVTVEFRHPDSGAVIGTELMRRRAGGCQGMGDLDHLVRSLSYDKCQQYDGCEVYEPRPTA